MRATFKINKSLFIAIQCVIGILLLGHGLSPAQTDYVVTELNFSGNQTLSSSELSAKMETYGTGFFKRALVRKNPYLFSARIFELDLKRLTKFYQSEGFLNVKIDHTLTPNHDDKQVKIHIKIDEGPPVAVNNINFRFKNGNSYAETIIDNLVKKLALQPGKRFRDPWIRADTDLISEKFGQNGFPYATVKPKLMFNSQQYNVDIIYHINSGLRCRFGQISIANNEKTPAAAIRKQLAFKPGDIFNTALIEKSQIQVYQLGFFQSVSIKYLMQEQQDDAIPIVISVTEAPRITAKFGIGYGREDKVRVFSDLTRLGFFGGARRLNLYLKHSELEPYHINLKFTQPAIFNPRTNFQTSAFARKEQEPGYTAQRIGTSPTLQHNYSGTTNGYLGYELEQVDQVVSEMKIYLGSTENTNTLYNKSGVKIGFVRETGQPKFSPRQGSFTAIHYLFSGLGFNSEFHFQKLIVEYRRYYSLTKDVVLASKIKIGAMKPWKSKESEVTPVEERFFSGGSMSVRGWARSQLGPKSEDNVPVGGNSLFEGSFELRFPVWKILSAAAFFDYGNVWREAMQQRAADLHFALGYGIRILTPIGPIRLDFGRPVFEGQRDFQIHLNVGQAF